VVGTISVVIPARDEALRIGPCLDGLLDDPDVLEVVVVDDGSTDATAEVARARGARVVEAGEPPAGWVGKPWALQRGLEEARGEVVVSVDADTRPRAGLAGAAAAALVAAETADSAEAADAAAAGPPSPVLVSVGARFVCSTAGERFLHCPLIISRETATEVSASGGPYR